MYEETVIYSPLSEQCVTSGLKSLKNPLPGGLVTLLAPLTVDLLILGLTITKAFKSNILSESHPSSPIVGVVSHFGFSSKPIPVFRCEQ